MNRRRSLLGLLLCSVLGCHAQEGIQLAPVTGKVLLDGQPLKAGSLTTLPAQGRGAHGQVDSEGHFVLETKGLGPGATIGIHQVAIAAYEGAGPSAANPEATLKLMIPSRYTQAAASGLSIDVKPDQVNDLTLQLTTAEK